jgi:competence protein ComEC
MFQPTQSPLRKYPFVRLLVALITGIIIQWYYKPAFQTDVYLLISFLVLLTGFSFLKQSKRFHASMAARVFDTSVIRIRQACSLTWRQNIENNPSWFGHVYKSGDALLLTIEEPLDEKPKSYKAVATVNAVFTSEKAGATLQERYCCILKKTARLRLTMAHK